ncbi:MAG: PHP domain-containing protein, partial [Actinomycetota bacterium]|nr:PHP domain-containing protein [Actinomycetota bacterium]
MFDPPPFAHLTVHSSYSLRDGAIRPREIAAAAALRGMTHIALTDSDGLYGAVRFAQACEATRVTPVFGTDLAIEPDATRPGWAMTRAGRARVRPEAPPASASPDPRQRRPRSGPAWLEDDAPRVVLLARDERGYGNLCRAVSAAHHQVDGRGDREDGRGNLRED